MAAPAEGLARVREALDAAAHRAGRDPSTVRLVAVGKTFPPEVLEAAYRAGQRDFGENRVQEAADKATRLPGDIRWHLVGHLQSNKAAQALQIFSEIHSLDGLKLARRLERLAGQADRTCRGLVQVDLAGEETKFGLAPEDLKPLLEEAAGFRHLQITGLMALPPYFADPEEVRPYFRRLRDLAADMEIRGLLGRHGPVELSMGMSHDFAVAVEEGATLVRLGTAIFGRRGPGGAWRPGD
jgi:pyridoxal phosphate enzyme (YggS family)